MHSSGVKSDKSTGCKITRSRLIRNRHQRRHTGTKQSQTGEKSVCVCRRCGFARCATSEAQRVQGRTCQTHNCPHARNRYSLGLIATLATQRHRNKGIDDERFASRQAIEPGRWPLESDWNRYLYSRRTDRQHRACRACRELDRKRVGSKAWTRRPPKNRPACSQSSVT